MYSDVAKDGKIEHLPLDITDVIAAEYLGLDSDGNPLPKRKPKQRAAWRNATNSIEAYLHSPEFKILGSDQGHWVDDRLVTDYTAFTPIGVAIHYHAESVIEPDLENPVPASLHLDIYSKEGHSQHALRRTLFDLIHYKIQHLKPTKKPIE